MNARQAVQWPHFMVVFPLAILPWSDRCSGEPIRTRSSTIHFAHSLRRRTRRQARFYKNAPQRSRLLFRAYERLDLVQTRGTSPACAVRIRDYRGVDKPWAKLTSSADGVSRPI